MQGMAGLEEEAGSAAAGGSQKRPAELAGGAGLGDQEPSAKSPRLENLPESLPGTADGLAAGRPAGAAQAEPAPAAQQLAAAQAEAARWREECEGLRRELELAQRKVGGGGGAGSPGERGCRWNSNIKPSGRGGWACPARPARLAELRSSAVCRWPFAASRSPLSPPGHTLLPACLFCPAHRWHCWRGCPTAPPRRARRPRPSALCRWEPSSQTRARGARLYALQELRAA